MDTDVSRLARCDHYRSIASELRALIPKMKNAEAINELCVLAKGYERLTEHLQAVSWPANDD